MNFYEIIEGPFLKISFAVMIGSLLIRSAFFGIALLKAASGKRQKWKFILSKLGRSAVPGHNLLGSRPLYVSIRYLFHACLFLIPIWFAGHVMLWEESVFNFNFFSIPYKWADPITLLVLFLIVMFIFQRLFFVKKRKATSLMDVSLLMIALLPYLTGYLLAHIELGNLATFMWELHILSGEVMLLTIGFLFVRARIDPAACMACTACVSNCPTQTLMSEDDKITHMRDIRYSHYQCICCGTCMETCPESAISLRHEISMKKFFQCLLKRQIHSDTLHSCTICGQYFIPSQQLKKLQKTVKGEFTKICQSCRKRKMTSYLGWLVFALITLNVNVNDVRADDVYKEQIEMNNSEYERHSKKNVIFPHQKHSRDFKIICSACHHDEDAEPMEGLSVGEYVEECISCHSIPTYITGKKDAEQFDYHTNTMHILCKGCHTKFNKKNKLKPWVNQAAPVRCYQCH